MTEYGTIRIPRDTYEKHNERRKDLGLTWEDYLDGNAPERADADLNEEAVADIVSQKLVDSLPRKIAGELSR